jgi:hypothetical protein
MRVKVVLIALAAWCLAMPALPAAAEWTSVTDARLTDPDKEPQNWLL